MRLLLILVVLLGLASVYVVVRYPGLFMPGFQPDPPDVRELSDGEFSVLLTDLTYSIGDTGKEIRVPRGFVTDFASIPSLLWRIGLQPHGRYSRAAIIHDYLYWTQQCSRRQSDNLLMLAMKESGVPPGHRIDIYRGVRLGGWASWRDNGRSRLRGNTKYVPESQLALRRDFTPWGELQPRLFAQGTRDPNQPSYANVCDLGNSIVVPKSGGQSAKLPVPSEPPMQQLWK